MRPSPPKISAKIPVRTFALCMMTMAAFAGTAVRATSPETDAAHNAKEQPVLRCMDAVGNYLYRDDDDGSAIGAYCEYRVGEPDGARGLYGRNAELYRAEFQKKGNALRQLCHAEWRGYWQDAARWMTPGNNPADDHFIQQQMRRNVTEYSPLEREIIFRGWLDDVVYYKLWFSGNRTRVPDGDGCFFDYANRALFQDDNLAFLENADIAARMIDGEFAPYIVALIVQIVRNLNGRTEEQAKWIGIFEENRQKLNIDEQTIALLHKFHSQNLDRVAKLPVDNPQ